MDKPPHTDVPEKLRAPIERILPSFVPVTLERGVPGYEAAPISLAGERRLSASEIRSLLAAAVFLGALEHASNLQFDMHRVRETLTRTLLSLPDLSEEERQHALRLVERFFDFKIIREDHPFDDWLCEAWWAEFQSIPYSYPSAMSEAVAYGLEVRRSLSKCTLEY